MESPAINIPLSLKDQAFLQRRRRLALLWNRVGALLLLGLVGMVGYLLWQVPLLINPAYVAAQIEVGAIAESTTLTMAVMLPVAVGMVFVVTAVIVIFGFAIFANERHYLNIIDRLQSINSSITNS